MLEPDRSDIPIFAYISLCVGGMRSHAPYMVYRVILFILWTVSLARLERTFDQFLQHGPGRLPGDARQSQPLAQAFGVHPRLDAARGTGPT
jgi:hypothetical protein